VSRSKTWLETRTLPAQRWVTRLFSCERDLLLARLILPGLRLVLATSQPFCVRALLSVTQRLRGLQLAQAKSQLSYGRVSSSAKPKLPGWQLERARPQLFSYGLSWLVKRMLRDWNRAADRGFAPQPVKRPQK